MPPGDSSNPAGRSTASTSRSPIGSGEGMTEVFVDRDDDDRRYKARGAGFYADEGKFLLDIGGRSGSTTIQAIKQMWSGELTGTVAATNERHRWLEPRAVRATLLISTTPDIAAQFMRQDLTDEGFPQRIVWAWAHYDHPDQAPDWPGPLEHPRLGPQPAPQPTSTRSSSTRSSQRSIDTATPHRRKRPGRRPSRRPRHLRHAEIRGDPRPPRRPTHHHHGRLGPGQPRMGGHTHGPPTHPHHPAPRASQTATPPSDKPEPTKKSPKTTSTSKKPYSASTTNSKPTKPPSPTVRSKTTYDPSGRRHRIHHLAVIDVVIARGWGVRTEHGLTPPD